MTEIQVTQLSNMKPVKFVGDDKATAFPDVDPGVRPYGQRVLVQLKLSARKTEAGLLVGEDATQTDQDNTKVAKVIAIGPLAFRNRETQAPWPEGNWANPGDFVRIPLHTNTQNAWTVPYKDSRVGFALIDDLQLLGEQPDPFYIKAWL